MTETQKIETRQDVRKFSEDLDVSEYVNGKIEKFKALTAKGNIAAPAFTAIFESIIKSHELAGKKITAKSYIQSLKLTYTAIEEGAKLSLVELASFTVDKLEKAGCKELPSK